jgi:hypothetical protein
MLFDKDGRHMTQTTPSRWRRKILGIPVVWLVVVLGAGIGLALLFSRMQSAEDTATARSVGLIDIGNAATEGLFAAALVDLEPGDSFVSCVRVVIDGQGAGETAALYAGPTSGGLADDLTLTVRRQSDSAAPLAAGPGIVGDNVAECEVGLTWTEPPIFTGTLAAFAAAHGSFATGLDFGDSTGHPGEETFRFSLALPIGVNGNDVAGQSATFSAWFENQTP